MDVGFIVVFCGVVTIVIFGWFSRIAETVGIFSLLVPGTWLLSWRFGTFSGVVSCLVMKTLFSTRRAHFTILKIESITLR